MIEAFDKDTFSFRRLAAKINSEDFAGRRAAANAVEEEPALRNAK
jgi:hypothetical protein